MFRGDNGGGTLWFRSELSKALKTCQILAFRPVFAPLYLDSAGSAAISPHHPARDFSRRLFLRVFGRARFCSRGKHTHSDCRKSRPGPRSEAGTEQEGNQRCSQASKPAAGNNVKIRIMQPN